ncbi:MAG: acyl esterase [Roseomonas sp.]|nr:acyl esterase [Roseomonas sp.]
MIPAQHPKDAGQARAGPLFSLCTLVTRHTEYAAMLESFAARGFTPDKAEFLYLDNSKGHQWDAFQGIRRFLSLARGTYVIICHQDIRLLADDIETLCDRLAALDALDADWALAGNAGAMADGSLVIRISDPHGEDQRRGAFPARVVSLDENFIIIRRDALVSVSAGLSGFHLYGTDMCLQARCAGRSAWVIDFHLRHLSAGKVDASFHQAQQRLEAHYDKLLTLPWHIRTTCTKMILGGGGLRRWLARRKLVRRLK